MSEEEGAPRGPNVRGAAEAIRREREGDGKKGRAKSTPEQRQRWREKKRRQAEARQASREPVQVGPAEIAVAAKLGAMLWKLSTLITGRRELNEQEKQDFGEALAPVIVKYAPMLDRWGDELVLGMTIWTLWESTGKKEEKKPESEPGADGSGASPEEAAALRVLGGTRE